MLTYIEERTGDRVISITVKLFRNVVGCIKPVDGGWQYFTRGGKGRGEVFKTLPALKRSLEES